MISESVSTVLAPRPMVHTGLRKGLEHGIAVGYGLTYDAIVRSFGPYARLLEDVVGYAARSVGPRPQPRSAHLIDIAAGIGTLAFRLAREGYTVTALDGVEYLVEIAREKRRARQVPNVAFHHLDIGRDTLPWQDAFDFAVSLHTLYWHPHPARILDATRRVLRPGGHALFLNYSRPAHVVPTFQQIRARAGWRPALGALRWLVPTAIFEQFRDYAPHYTDEREFHELLTQAGFEILEAKRTFLADISVLAWVRRAR
jgi:ubiquinone/menaquinone biosynthesis C-methylase UbiE